jgi:hypothetical protein
MNTYIFTPEAKSFLIKGFVIGLVLFVIGVVVKWDAGHESTTNNEHHSELVSTNSNLLAENHTDEATATVANTAAR